MSGLLKYSSISSVSAGDHRTSVATTGNDREHRQRISPGTWVTLSSVASAPEHPRSRCRRFLAQLLAEALLVVLDHLTFPH